MHPLSPRFGAARTCSLLIGGVLAVAPPAFCGPPPANPTAQAVADDPSSANSGGTRQPSPRSPGAEFPVPPRQGQPWTPPATALPREVVDAVKAIFDVGVADPRGCEYREIKVTMGARGQGDAGVVTTHGWVLPGNEGFAVCWNGLVYPVLSAAAAADLHADVAAFLQADQEEIKKKEAELRAVKPDDQEPTVPGLSAEKRFDPYARGNVPERAAVSYQTILPFKAVLLLRLGEGELAARLWSQWYDATEFSRPKNPFLWMAGAWAWANFDRAASAHLSGDDRLALASAHVLASIQSAYGAEEARRQFEMPYGVDSQLGFLDQVPALIADSERRLADAPYTPVLATSPPPKSSERIAGLIRDLELVSEGYWRPCGANDPIVEALVQEGEPAVEPLLRCVETDTRLTRAVRSQVGPTFPGVQEPAFTALQSILRTNSFGRDDMATIDDLIERGLAGRKVVADEIRAWRDKYGKLSVAQRWYEMLRDPQNGQWTEAVDWIVQPAYVSQTFAGKFSGRADMDPPAQGEPKFALQGESLRSLTNPSVSELLVQRLRAAEQALDAKASDPGVGANLASADKAARALATWDGASQLDVLRDFSRRLRDLFDQAATLRPALVPPLAATYKNRADLGDATALDEYAVWLITVPLDGLEAAAASLLRPAWMHPESPRVQQAVAELFAKTVKWSPVLKPGQDPFHSFASLLSTPLVGLAGFRAELLRGLRDQHPGGEEKITEDQVKLEAGDGGSFRGVQHDPPLVLREGTVVPHRICDIYASALSSLPGAPRCELYWPEANRDEAIRQTVAYLETFGDNLQRGPDQPDSGSDMLRSTGGGDSWFLGWPHDADQVRLGFPALDGPATAEDVRAHRAIFALEGERRLYKLPERPMRVIWTTLQDAPLCGQSTDADGKTTTSFWYDQWAGAWQAEEVLKDGHWQRFIGVVSAHQVARVPAAEIEFYLPDEWYMVPDQWRRLDHGFGGVLTVPHTQGEWLPSGHAYDPVPQGQPVQATLQVRNQLALDQALPADLFQADKNAKTLPPGVKLTLLYSAKVAPASNARTAPPRPEELQPWTEVPCRVEIPVAGTDGNTVPMASLEARTVFQIDLRDFFDLSRPGSYRLRADFQRASVLVGQPAEATFTIVAAP